MKKDVWIGWITNIFNESSALAGKQPDNFILRGIIERIDKDKEFVIDYSGSNAISWEITRLRNAYREKFEAKVKRIELENSNEFLEQVSQERDKYFAEKGNLENQNKDLQTLNRNLSEKVQKLEQSLKTYKDDVTLTPECSKLVDRIAEIEFELQMQRNISLRQKNGLETI